MRFTGSAHPKAPSSSPRNKSPQLVYDRTIDGEEFLGLLIIDPRTGPLLVAMSLSMTGLVAGHMTVTLAPENIDRLRADWESKNGDKRNG